MARDETTEQTEWDIDAFEDWLSQVAESRDISEGAVLDRMMSSYWVLDEFEELLEERDLEAGVDAASPPDSSASPDDTASAARDTEDDADASHVELARFLEMLESLRPVTPSADAGTESSTVDQRSGDTARIDVLQRELTLLTAKVERLADQQSSQSESLEAAKEALSESDDEAVAEDVLESVEELESAVASLRERLSTVEDAQQTVRENLNDDLSHIEEVLRYLVDHTNEFDGRLEELDRLLEEELDAFWEERAGRQNLERLMRTANELGVTVAACGRCDESVELGLLLEPSCPHCAAPFVDVTPKQGWFGSPTVETSPQGISPAETQERRTPPRPRKAESRPGTRRGSASDAGSGDVDEAASTDGAATSNGGEEDPGDRSGDVPDEFDWQSGAE